MRAVVVLFLLLATSCAAHNAHRIPIDLNADLAPLIDEAWARMEEGWNQPVPRGTVPVDIAVEPVDVQWLPFSPEVPPGGEVIAQADLAGTIASAMQPEATPASLDAQQRVRLALLTDLHEPDALQIQVRCHLLDADGRERAQGNSIIVRFPRLYCHGCRDRLFGHGTHLQTQASPSDDGGYEFHGGFFFYWPGSSPGYHKN